MDLWSFMFFKGSFTYQLINVYKSELGEEPGCDTSLRYDIGQVVKCRVARSDPASYRIYLSLLDSPTETCEDDMIKLG